MASNSENNQMAESPPFSPGTAHLVAYISQVDTHNNNDFASSAPTTPDQPSEETNPTAADNRPSREVVDSARGPVPESNSETNSNSETQGSAEVRPEAGRLPRKVGEIGYVPPSTPSRRSSQDNNSLTHPLPNFDFGPALPADIHQNTRASSTPLSSGWEPTSFEASEEGNSSNRALGQRKKISARKLFLKPTLLLIFGAVILGISSAAFAHTQEKINRSNHASKNTSNNSNDETTDNSEGSTTSNLSFVYIGAIFMVAILVEIWILVGSLRNLYHRLGVWVDQEYPLPVPDLSDPNAPLPPPRPLPWWAKLLKIKPEVVRPPPLPPYTAVLNIIRTGGRSGSSNHGTGDVEDGEVIRNLAIGQGEAAPAFNGEEFRKSTVLLSGPPKRESVQSTNTPTNSSQGFMQSLSRGLNRTFGSLRGSRVQENSEDDSSLQEANRPMSQMAPSILTLVEIDNHETNSTTIPNAAHLSGNDTIQRQSEAVV